MALTGCKPTESMFIQEAFVLNYEEIAGPDFLITESDAVGFDYVGVASLDGYELTGATKIEKKDRRDKDDGYGDRVVTYYDTSGKRVANMRSALGYAVQEAKKLGGDGIIRLRTKQFGMRKSVVLDGSRLPATPPIHPSAKYPAQNVADWWKRRNFAD